MIKELDIYDIDAVLQIEESSFGHPWLKQHFLDEFSKKSSVCRAIYENGKLCGYLILSVVADEAEILDLAVSTEKRRCGFGKMLLDDAVELCRRRGVEKLYLEVRSTSLPALAFYRTYGFTDCGVRKKYYENGIDAILMTLDLYEVNNAV